jgi:hypothetical protein
MKPVRDLSSFETVESMFEQIKGDYFVSESDKPIILNLLEEYFRLKENAVPSVISVKWTEIEKNLKLLEPKVNQ